MADERPGDPRKSPIRATGWPGTCRSPVTVTGAFQRKDGSTRGEEPHGDSKTQGDSHRHGKARGQGKAKGNDKGQDKGG